MKREQCLKKSALFADDSSERLRGQRDVPPFLADVRGGACSRRIEIGDDICIYLE
jgi:hypothetical protein